MTIADGAILFAIVGFGALIGTLLGLLIGVSTLATLFDRVRRADAPPRVSSPDTDRCRS